MTLLVLMSLADEVGGVGDAKGAGSMLNKAATGGSNSMVPHIRRDEGLTG